MSVELRLWRSMSKQTFNRLLQNDKAGEEYLQMRLTTEGRKLVQISNQQVTEIKLLERPLISALMRDSGLRLRASPTLGAKRGRQENDPSRLAVTASIPCIGRRSDAKQGIKR